MCDVASPTLFLMARSTRLSVTSFLSWLWRMAVGSQATGASAYLVAAQTPNHAMQLTGTSVRPTVSMATTIHLRAKLDLGPGS